MQRKNIFIILGPNDNVGNMINKFKYDSMTSIGENWFLKFNNIKYEVTINHMFISFDDIHNELEFLIHEAWTMCSHFSASEPMGKEKQGETLKGAILSQVHKYSWKENFSVLDIAVDIFISLVNGHKLINGNKRISFAFLITFLKYLGLSFSLDEYSYKARYDQSYKIKVEKFAIELEKDGPDIFNSYIRTDILEWIFNNCKLLLRNDRWYNYNKEGNNDKAW